MRYIQAPLIIVDGAAVFLHTSPCVKVGTQPSLPVSSSLRELATNLDGIEVIFPDTLLEDIK